MIHDTIARQHVLILPNIQKTNEKNPRKGFVRRFGCKARGLTQSHNQYENAYIEIPSNADHGLLLRCSSPVCASSGRRFRYCQVCDIPVAKRNFLARHGHGLLNPSKVVQEHAGTPQKRRAVMSQNAKKQVKLGGKTKKGSTNKINQEVRVISSNYQAPLDRLPPTAAANDILMSHKVKLSNEEMVWLSLFHQRPDRGMEDHKSKMNAWVEQVVDFANATDEKLINEPSSSSSLDDIVMPSDESEGSVVKCRPHMDRISSQNDCFLFETRMPTVYFEPDAIGKHNHSLTFDSVDMREIFEF